ncbi:hypothetical protein NDU88_001376 [Pleurodeles waltl]|uniref:Uncharacterized protein n=1 Tax=Pleurodeles waltl TaxID=8319 RepID=A0AAV7LZ59_PLEWA|nr:hypothetical protein NDU88_001376 [Pleurodeles waltl]
MKPQGSAHCAVIKEEQCSERRSRQEQRHRREQREKRCTCRNTITAESSAGKDAASRREELEESSAVRDTDG